MISPGVGNGNALQLSEKPAVAAVCAAPARRHGRQRRTGLVNTTRTAGKRHKKEKSGERPTVCWRELDSNLRSLSKPEILLPRCSGYPHYADLSWRGSHGSAFLLLRVEPLEPLHRAGLGHVLNRLWLAALRGGRCLLFVEFGDAPTFHLRVEHFQGSAASSSKESANCSGAPFV